jgi:hypothetical protein
LQEVNARTVNTANADEKSFFIEVLYFRVIGFESRATQIATTKIRRETKKCNPQGYTFFIV